MFARWLARPLISAALLLTSIAATSARADLIILVNDMEILRIAGDLGMNQSRGLPATDIRVSDDVLIRGLRVESTNFEGLGGDLLLFFQSQEFTGSGPIETRIRISETYDVDPTVSLFKASHEFGTRVQFTGLDQAVEIDQQTRINNSDLPRLTAQASPAHGELEIESFRFGETQVGSMGGGGGGAGKVSVQDLTLTIRRDISSPNLYVACLSGEHCGRLRFFAVPEPSTLTLLAPGTLGLLGYGWRHRKRAV